MYLVLYRYIQIHMQTYNLWPSFFSPFPYIAFHRDTDMERNKDTYSIMHHGTKFVCVCVYVIRNR